MLHYSELNTFLLSQVRDRAAADDLWIELNEKLEQFFCLLDVNGDGQLPYEHFERVCGRPNMILLKKEITQQVSNPFNKVITQAQLLDFFQNQVQSLTLMLHCNMERTQSFTSMCLAGCYANRTTSNNSARVAHVQRRILSARRP